MSPNTSRRRCQQGSPPWLTRVLAEGTALIAECVVPTFTNPNNLSIVTGAPPSVHGICGNYWYDPASGAEVMMNDPKRLRAPTILSGLATAGASCAVITAKDKLRNCWATACAASASPRTGGPGQPGREWHRRRAGDGRHAAARCLQCRSLRIRVSAAGVQLMRGVRPDLMYLSTTDYVQHKHAPGTPGANAFYAMIDRYLAQLDAAGCVIALTADHGMNAKTGMDGRPDVIYLQDLMDEVLN